MAPKKPFKVHSLNKHVEDTQKGLTAEAQYNRRAATASALKKHTSGIDSNIFPNNDDDDEDSNSDSNSDDSSDAEVPDAFMRKLTQTSSAPKKPAAALETEIANSDTERKPSNPNKASPNKAVSKAVASTDDSSSEGESGSESDSESGSGSSSEEDAEDDLKNKSQANGAAVTTATTTTSPTSSSGEDSSDDDDSNTNGVKIQKSTAAQGSSSEESGSGSEESGSESEASEPQITKKPAVNGKAPATSSSSSDASSDSESDDEPEQPAKKITTNAAPVKVASTKVSAPVSESGTDDSASSDEDNAAVDESMHISDREEAGQLTGPKFIAPDFMIRRGDKEVNGKDVAEVCNQANLQGKQFWYFTVPSDIPISVVQNMEIPLDTAQRGDTVFSHNGDSYGVSFDSMTPKSTIQILIPTVDGSKYRAAPRAVDQVVQVKRITNLGGSSTGTADPTYKRPVRPQPKGLKARYKPIGVSNSMGNIGDESEGEEADTEMADAPSLPALPTKSSAADPAKEKKKRKSKVAVEGETVPDTPKKSKKAKEKASEDTDSTRKGKRKLTSSEEDAVAASSQLMGENQLAESKSKKQKTDRAGSPDLSTKVTPVTVPTPGYSFSDLPDAPTTDTPKAATKKTAIKKKADKAPTAENGETTPGTKKASAAKKSESKVNIPVLPSSSQATASRHTPIAPPVIYGQPVPSSSAPAPPASTPTPATKTTKKAGGKKKDASQVKQ